jgi:hypothetical protein
MTTGCPFSADARLRAPREASLERSSARGVRFAIREQLEQNTGQPRVPFRRFPAAAFRCARRLGSFRSMRGRRWGGRVQLTQLDVLLAVGPVFPKLDPVRVGLVHGYGSRGNPPADDTEVVPPVAKQPVIGDLEGRAPSRPFVTRGFASASKRIGENR